MCNDVFSDDKIVIYVLLISKRLLCINDFLQELDVSHVLAIYFGLLYINNTCHPTYVYIIMYFFFVYVKLNWKCTGAMA